MFALVLPVLAQPMWQLSFNFAENGDLALLAATRIGEMEKTARSPDAGGGAELIPVRLTWLDAQGGEIAESRCFLPVGRSIPLLAGEIESTETGGRTAGDEVLVIREPGPGVDEEVETLRVTYIEDEPAPSGDSDQTRGLEREFTFGLNSSFASRFNPPPDPISATKIRDTGSDGSRLVLVILGDGYTQAELDSGKYASDVETSLAAFNNASPWDQMIKATNVYRIDVASNESGSDYENAAPGQGGVTKDTYFHTRFYSEFVTGQFIPHLLTPSAEGRNRAIEAADAKVGVGVWDQLVIVVNSPVYGGAGGVLSVNSMHPSGPLISVHEVGHSLAGLADEYGAPNQTYTGQPPIELNVDINGNSPKWGIWIDSPQPPMPTPDSPAYAGVVGAFEGGRYNDNGIYRPWRSCRMRDLVSDFCPICKEQHLKSLFASVPFTDSVSPAASTTAAVSSSQTFAVNSIPLDEISYEWFLDGEKIAGADSATLPLSTANLPAPSQTLLVNAAYTSAMMRSGAPSDTFSWIVQNTGVSAAGTPHWWLASHNLSATAGEDMKDHDGDGQSTAAEYIAGTSPSDNLSVLKFSTVDVAPSGGMLRFDTIAGHNYRLETCIKLDDWTGVPGYESIAGGATVTYNLPSNGGEKRFYRVMVWIP